MLKLPLPAFYLDEMSDNRHQDEKRRLYHGFRIEPADLRSRDGEINSQLRKHFEWKELR